VFTARYGLNLYTYSTIVSFLKVVIRHLGTPDPELVSLLRRSAVAACWWRQDGM
jgi:hypothetical protein